MSRRVQVELDRVELPAIMIAIDIAQDDDGLADSVLRDLELARGRIEPALVAACDSRPPPEPPEE